MNELFALGISYKTAPVELRERVALPEGRAASVLRELVSTGQIAELAELSRRAVVVQAFRPAVVRGLLSPVVSAFRRTVGFQRDDPPCYDRRSSAVSGSPQWRGSSVGRAYD